MSCLRELPMWTEQLPLGSVEAYVLARWNGARGGANREPKLAAYLLVRLG
jgi:hypothetical protein